MFSLPPLPFAPEALEPHMSARTLSFHHGKHHQAYVDKANAAIKDGPLANASDEEVVRAAKAQGNQGLFNNAAQAWNHSFLWNSLSPSGGGAPSGQLKELIDRDLGGVEGFAEKFKAEAVGHFASGWAWLVHDGQALKVVSTHDADTALVHEGLKPLVVLDLWEHAYYLDYQNARPGFVDAFLAKMINWDFTAKNLAA
ncbi:MAG: superoxide dismutase [Sphingomonadaceae bacterium]|nr:superoxide dismutase [Sphingomonadaceae bacterium]